MRRSERGNALMYVLIGVVLFAALGYALSQSSRGSTSALTEERTKLAASEIIEYGTIVANAVGQLRLRGFDSTEISFDNNFVSYPNGNCGDDTCKIFHPDGAGVVYRVPDTDWLDTINPAPTLYGEWYFPDKVCVENAGTGGSGCDSDDAYTDLVIILPYIREEVCVEINNKVGVTNPSDVPPVVTGNAWATTEDRFAGAFNNDEAISNGTGNFSSKMAGCFEGSAAGSTPKSDTFHYYQVLISR